MTDIVFANKCILLNQLPKMIRKQKKYIHEFNRKYQVQEVVFFAFMGFVFFHFLSLFYGGGNVSTKSTKKSFFFFFVAFVPSWYKVFMICDNLFREDGSWLVTGCGEGAHT